MELSLSNKTVFISGSSSGIGYSIAESFIREGAKVFLNGRSLPKLIEASKNLNCEYIHADVSTIEGAKKVSQFFTDKGLSIDILICNAGSGASVPPGEESFDEWEKVFKNNFYVCTNLIEATKSLLQNDKSVILAISSICGQASLGAPLTYSASKAALNSYIKGTARVFGQKGIRVNAIAPGNILFKGSVWEKKLEKNFKIVSEMLEKEVSLKRLGQPEEVANLACFLCSEKSSFLTSQIIVLDGGQLRS